MWILLISKVSEHWTVLVRKGGSTGTQARNTVGDCTERRKEREDDMDKGNREVRGKRTAHSFTSH